MKLNLNFRRAATLMSAVVVSTLTFGVVAKATQTISTPNAYFVGYYLNPGQDSSPIYPPTYQAVNIMGVQTALGYRGVGSVTMLRITSSFLEWVGLESPYSASITSGYSGSAGTHIVYLDFSHQVDLRVSTPDSFVVHNASGSVRYGNVTMIW